MIEKKNLDRATVRPSAREAVVIGGAALLPCPFCGSQPRIRNDFDDMRSVVVGCDTCGARSVTHEYEKGLRPQAVRGAVAAWNRRAAPVVQPRPFGAPPEAREEGAAEAYAVIEIDGLRVGPAMLREFIADARRYRWLREQDPIPHSILSLQPTYFDAAIDAARAKEPSRG